VKVDCPVGDLKSSNFLVVACHNLNVLITELTQLLQTEGKYIYLGGDDTDFIELVTK
jgi:hypothetical protein